MEGSRIIILNRYREFQRMTIKFPSILIAMTLYESDFNFVNIQYNLDIPRCIVRSIDLEMIIIFI